MLQKAVGWFATKGMFSVMAGVSTEEVTCRELLYILLDVAVLNFIM